MATYGKGRTSGTRGWERGDESQREIREGRDIREGTVGAARRVGRRAKLLPLVRYVSRYGRSYGKKCPLKPSSPDVAMAAAIS